MAGTGCRTLTLALAALAAPAFAQTNEQVLPEVKVRAATPESPVGPDRGYRAGRSTAGTKTDTPLIETPQSVSIVTRERMEDQGATSVQDALNYTAGVRSDAYGLDSRSDNVRVRGAYPDEYRDGLRRLFGYYTSTTRVDPYALERLEVLRGPAAMLYGQGSTGGIINMVSKRPLPEPRREIGVQLGTFGRKQIQTDLSGPLTQDGEWLYRLVALGRKSDTQVDHVPDDRALVAPSLTWRPGAATSLTLQATWQRNETGSTAQFFPWSGVVTPNPNGRIPTDRFVGEPGFDRYDSERAELGWLFEHRLSEQWTVRQNTRFSRNEVDYRTIYADSFTNPTAPFIDANQRVLDRIAFLERRENRMLTADQHLDGRFATGSVHHHLLAGVDLIRFKEDSQNAGGTPAPIDVFDPVYTGFTPTPFVEDPQSTLRQTGVYLQDQMKIGRWIVVAGLRHDQSVSGLAGSADESDNAVTKRGGLMYQLGNGLAPYVSYSESFTPIAGTNLAGERFKPLRGEQVEAGLKWEPVGSRTAYSAAFYELDEKFQRIPDPNNPLDQTQAGATHTRGLELEAIGRLLPQLDLAAHYNYTDLDSELEGLPTHQAAVWGTYRFDLEDLTGLRAGLGVRYMGSFKDGVAPETPSVTLVDAMVGLDRGPWRYALNVQNLADKIYVSTCLGRGDCWYGSRRTVIASATYRF
jgi:iron complex outermembrane recepter protein